MNLFSMMSGTNRKSSSPTATPVEDESEDHQYELNQVPYEDILPSFDMYNYILNRSILDTERPPNYSNDDIHPQSSAASSDPVHEERYVVDPTLTPDLTVLNNLNNIQRINSPIKLSVVLTKRSRTLKPISKFREYKPGDLVTGYIIIENDSDDEIPFEMFLVSLEGNITTKSFYNTNLTAKLFRKCFLKMYDLCACYHMGVMQAEPSGDKGFEDELCTETGAWLGFPDSKILEPRSKYQKEFMFKLPDVLLDTTCQHQLPDHLILPASFGVDNEGFDGKCQSIPVNTNLGYGLLNDIDGSPIRIRDYTDPGQSISYSINVKMLGSNLKLYEKYHNEKKIDKNCDFLKLQDRQYFFRVSTQGCNLLELPNYLNSNATSTDAQVKQIQKIFDDIIEELQYKSDLIKSGIVDTQYLHSIISQRPDSKKQEQLGSLNITPLTSTSSMSNTSTSTNAKQEVENVTSCNLVKSLFTKYEGNLTFKVAISKNASISTIIPKNLKHVFHSHSNPLSHRSTNTSISHRLTPFGSHKISGSTETSTPAISSYNSQQSSIQPETLTLAAAVNSIPLPSSCTPTSTLTPFPAETLATRPNKVRVNLTFNPRNNSPPPPSLLITPKLEVINFQSEFDIPINIDAEYLMESSAIETTYGKLIRLKKKMVKNLLKLEQLLREMNNGLGILRSFHEGLIALSKLTLTIAHIRIFKKIDMCDELNWVQDRKTGVYNCSFEVELNINWEEVNNLGCYFGPGFQTCALSRFYYVKLEFESGSSKAKYKEPNVFATLPISIV